MKINGRRRKKNIDINENEDKNNLIEMENKPYENE